MSSALGHPSFPQRRPRLCEQVKLQLTREPRSLPKLILKRKPASIYDYTYDYTFEDFEIVGYDPHPHIPAPVSI